ncbi:NADPH:quinone reductase [Pseudoalteromonas luteoviolacea B = ATCC 29581]|nr:NADPH:quinone reductase [Pseudoalteromonas luteoviolacea B = ATCC 29581]
MNTQSYGITDFGSATTLVCRSGEIPPLDNSKVRVKIKSCSVNPIDVKTRAGLGFVAANKAPHVFLPLGYDLFGEVIAAPPLLQDKIGMQVLGMVGFPHSPGTYSSFIDVDINEVIFVPAVKENLLLGGLSLAGLTAYQAIDLFDKTMPLYVSGSTGGVGHLAIQIAALKGYEVIAVSTKPSHSLFATIQCSDRIKVISFDTFFKQKIKAGFLDLVGGEVGKKCIANLQPESVVVTVPTISKELLCEFAMSNGIQAQGMVVSSNTEHLFALYNWVKKGELTLVVEYSYALEDVASAHQRLESGNYVGKLLITV